jgi:hexosaminidase
MNPEPAVVPALQQWTPGQGKVSLRDAGIVVEQKSAAALTPIAKILQQDLKAIGFGEKPIATADSASTQSGIVLELVDKSPAEGLAFPDQAYSIDIGDSVVIRARAPVGVFYGTRTLLQMLKAEPTTAALSRGRIVDYPTSGHRMMMLDVGRKVFPYGTLLDYLRMMAWFKMNELHLHLSDEAFGGGYAAFRVECSTYPGLTSKDCFYTKQQLRTLQDIAKSYGITITPEIDMPGHATVFTNYWPDLKNKHLSNAELDVTNPQTIERLKKLLDEMIPIFDAPDFHIGTDEYRVNGSAAEKQPFYDAFHQFINTMNAYVRSKGKNCRVWDGWEHMTSKIEIDPTVVVDMWWAQFDAKAYAARGHRIINSNQGRSYIVPGAAYYGVSNAGIYDSWVPTSFGKSEFNPDPSDPHVHGGKFHVWNDQGPTGYTMTEIASLVQPSMTAFSEKMWGRKGSKDYKEFEKRTAIVEPVPGVSVLDRIPAANKDGVVLAVPGEHTLAADKSQPLAFAGKSRADLEYPWTLAMNVRRTGGDSDRGVILSSDLMEICANYSRQEEEKKKDPITGAETKTKVTRTGFGLVRAAGNPGEDPSKSHIQDLNRVYSEPLPLNQWVAVAVVGLKGRTQVYLDGKLVGEQGKQMLCPLATLGSRTGHSMVGSVKDVTIFDRALTAKEIGRKAGLDVPDNLAAGCPVTASATDAANGFTPEKITDQDPATRWSSGMTSADQWIMTDLGKVQNINAVAIRWETAYPKEYRVAVSTDGHEWKDVFTGAGQAGLTEASFATVPARQIKITMSKPASQWGYSIFETEVFSRKAH